MQALIDGDIILWRVGRTTDNDPEWVARARAEEMLDGILTNTNATSFQVFLSDSRENNFRWQLWNGYKANRPPDKPTHYDFLKEHMLLSWGTRIAHDMEADDALGIWQDKEDWDKTVICSIDKDLLQIPGQHFNFVKNEFYLVSPEEGLRHFYKQMLIGDTSDNIKGCRGIGPVKADKLIGKMVDEEEILSVIYETYLKQEESMSSEEILQHMLLVGRLLKIKQHKEEGVWMFPHALILNS